MQYQKNAFSSKPGNLYVYGPQPKPADPYINTWLNIDYELQQETKPDYLPFESSRALQASEMNLVKIQCEQEGIHIFTTVMLSLEKPRLAGYFLTGKDHFSGDKWKLSMAQLLSIFKLTLTQHQPMLRQNTHHL